VCAVGFGEVGTESAKKSKKKLLPMDVGSRIETTKTESDKKDDDKRTEKKCDVEKHSPTVSLGHN
jgi:hypothetical protein